MSLHNEILAIRGDTEDNSASYTLGLCDAKQEAAALAIKADAEIARLTGENAVLRDLLRDALEIVASEEDWTDRDWSEFANALAIRIIKAINGLGAWVSDGAEVSDGAIYETASRRAAPESHAEMDKLMAIIEDVNDHDRECEIPPVGWRCTRRKGHSGPCAAVPSPEDLALVERGMNRLREATGGQSSGLFAGDEK